MELTILKGYLVGLVPDGRAALELGGFGRNVFGGQRQVVRARFDGQRNALVFGVGDHRNGAGARQVHYVTRHPGDNQVRHFDQFGANR